MSEQVFVSIVAVGGPVKVTVKDGKDRQNEAHHVDRLTKVDGLSTPGAESFPTLA